MKHYRICVAVFLVVSLTVTLGCGPKMQRVRGKVTYSDTGEPLDAGFVCFASGATFARGTIKKDGTYTMGSATETDGLPLGTYQVYIGGAERSIGKRRPTDDDEQYVPLIAHKHTTPETSGLTFVVERSSPKEFNITVDRAPASPSPRK